MKRTVAIVLALCVLLTGLPARADDHLVSRSTVQTRLSQVAAQRQVDLTVVRSVLVSPEAITAASRVGLDAHALFERVATLSDEELRDVAERAALLNVDPVAGGARKTVIIVVVILVVLGLLSFLISPEAYGP
jgi:hypothetical protein